MTRKCKVCKNPYEPRLPMQVVCGMDCAKSLAVSVRGKAEKKKAVQERAETRRRKEAIKTLPQLLREAQKEFNAWIRARDAKQPCIPDFHRVPEEHHWVDHQLNNWARWCRDAHDIRISPGFSSFPGIAEIRKEVSGRKQATVVGAADVYVSDFGDMEIVPHYMMTGSTSTLSWR